MGILEQVLHALPHFHLEDKVFSQGTGDDTTMETQLGTKDSEVKAPINEEQDSSNQPSDQQPKNQLIFGARRVRDPLGWLNDYVR